MSEREMRRPYLAVLGLLAALLTVGHAQSGGTRIATLTPAELSVGRGDGVAVSTDGALSLAPTARRLVERLPGSPAQIWALAADGGGNLFLATGPDGHLLRVRASGSAERLFSLDEPLATALAWDDESTLLVGGSPGGKVYRVSVNGVGSVWSELEEPYVWALTAEGNGTVWAATGERGRLLKLSSDGSPRIFFDSNQAHLRSIARQADGTLVAAGAPAGTAYVVDGDGHARVLHDDDLAEIVAVAPRDGSVIAALTAAAPLPPRRPELEIVLPDGVARTVGADSIDSLDAGDPARVTGIIEGLREQQPERDLAGKILELDPDGRVRELWRSRSLAPLAMALEPGGRVLFGTGSPAALFAIDGEGRTARLASFDEQQVTAILPVGAATIVATSNPAAVYRLEITGSAPGIFTSPPMDAGAVARWGHISWETGAGPGAAELSTRTGATRVPDETWSGWSPPLVAGTTIASPDGRFLQWRARLTGSRTGDAVLRDVRVSYEPHNRPPEASGFRRETRPGAPAPVELVWNERDPDGDRLTARLRVIGADGDERRIDLTDASAPAQGSDWREHRHVWNTDGMDEGSYQVELVLSDATANARGEGLESRGGGRLQLVVDRTAPSIELEPGGVVRVRDDHSPVLRLSLVRDGAVVYSLRPDDGLCDSPEEVFRLRWDGPPTDVVLRADDAVGNSSERALQGAGE